MAGGTASAAAGAGSAGKGLEWNQTLPAGFLNSIEFTRLQYGRPYRFVGGARHAEPSLKLGIGEHWRGFGKSTVG
jgi:hypothetical protein